MISSVHSLSKRLSVDPYRVDLLVERLLMQAAAQNLDAARSDLATIQRLGVARTFGPTLARLVAGELRITEEAEYFLIFDPAVDSVQVGWTLHLLRDARAVANRFFGRLDRCLLVELSPQLSGFHHASSEVPGIAYVKLSPRASLSEHEAIITHELAHVYLTSGNRFIDEGIAVYFQARAHRGRFFAGSEFETADVLKKARRDVIPLRAFLAYDGRNDVFFERLLPEPRRKEVVYAAAHIFVAYLLDTLGMPGLKALCASLRACPAPAAHPTLIERILSFGIEALDQALFRTPRSCETPDSFKPSPSEPSSAVSTDSSLEGLSLESSARVMWSVLEPGELNRFIQRLRETLAQDASAVTVKATLARALIRRVLEHTAEACPPDFAESRSLVYDLSIEFNFPDRDRMVLEGWLAIAQTHAASSMPSRIVSWEKALDTFRRALLRYPDDPEVLCASAILHLRGPEEHGASRALAQSCLDTVRRVEGWSALADSIETAHGVAHAQ